jgi:uncharacterized membrane protein required for colicin V production
MSVNFVDFLVVFFLVFFLWQGYKTGFLAGVFNIISTLISLGAAIFFYPNLGQILVNWFGWSENISLLVAFFAIFIFLELILSFIFHRIYVLISPAYIAIRGLLIWDRVLGLIPSALVGLFIVSLVLLVILILPKWKNASEAIGASWWGRNVLTRALKYQPQIESVLNRLPYRNLAYLITPKPLSKESIELNLPEEIKLTPDNKSEKAMFGLVNRERSNRGLNKVVWDDTLLKPARDHCLDMFERGYFSHYSPEGDSPFDRLDKLGIEYKAAILRLSLSLSKTLTVP